MQSEQFDQSEQALETNPKIANVIKLYDTKRFKEGYELALKNRQEFEEDTPEELRLGAKAAWCLHRYAVQSGEKDTDRLKNFKVARQLAIEVQEDREGIGYLATVIAYVPALHEVPDEDGSIWGYEQLKQIIRDNPGNWMVLNAAAIALQKNSTFLSENELNQLIGQAQEQSPSTLPAIHALNNLGKALVWNTERYEDAQHLLAEALERYEEHPDNNSDHIASLCFALAAAYEKNSQSGERDELWQASQMLKLSLENWLKLFQHLSQHSQSIATGDLGKAASAKEKYLEVISKLPESEIDQELVDTISRFLNEP